MGDSGWILDDSGWILGDSGWILGDSGWILRDSRFFWFFLVLLKQYRSRILMRSVRFPPYGFENKEMRSNSMQNQWFLKKNVFGKYHTNKCQLTTGRPRADLGFLPWSVAVCILQTMTNETPPCSYRGLRKKRPPAMHAHIPPSYTPIFNIEHALIDKPGCAKTGVFFAASGPLLGAAILKPGVKGGRVWVHPLLGAGVYFAATGITQHPTRIS